jgi:hypothetical protein
VAVGSVPIGRSLAVTERQNPYHHIGYVSGSNGDAGSGDATEPVSLCRDRT